MEYAIVNPKALEALLNLVASNLTYAQCHQVIHAVQQSVKPYRPEDAILDFLLKTDGEITEVPNISEWQEAIKDMVKTYKETGKVPPFPVVNS